MKKYSIILALATYMGTLVAEREVCGCASWQALGGAGYAWSMNTTICTGSDWAPAREGYCGLLGESPFYFIGFSKNVWQWLNVGFKYTAYNGFNYQKYQTADSSAVELPHLLRTRFFNLGNTSYMATAQFIPQFECIQNNYVQPIIGVGLGLSHFVMTNFHTVAYAPTATTPAVNIGTTTSIGRPATSNSVAAEVLLGAQSVCSEYVSFGVFYSFYYGGKFTGPCRFVQNTTLGAGAEGSLTPWRGHLMANQILFKLEWNF